MYVNVNVFSKSLGSCSAYVAELWGVFEGLHLLRMRGYAKVLVQVDSAVVVQAITGDQMGSTSGWSLLREIRKLLRLVWEVKVVHVYREANRCADAMAALGATPSQGLIIYENPPESVGRLVLADMMGAFAPRLVVL